MRTQSFDASTDRSKGVAVEYSGDWFQVVGDVPLSLTVQVNDQSWLPLVVVPYQLYRVGFRRLIVTHVAGLASRTFTIVSGSAAEDPGAPAVPQLVRDGDFLAPIGGGGLIAFATIAAATSVQLTTVAGTGRRVRLLGYRMSLNGASTLAAAGQARGYMNELTGSRIVGDYTWRVSNVAGSSPVYLGPWVNFQGGLPLATNSDLFASSDTAFTAGGIIFEVQYSLER